MQGGVRVLVPSSSSTSQYLYHSIIFKLLYLCAERPAGDAKSNSKKRGPLFSLGCTPCGIAIDPLMILRGRENRMEIHTNQHRGTDDTCALMSSQVQDGAVLRPGFGAVSNGIQKS
jgi:hypothetical protein